MQYYHFERLIRKYSTTFTVIVPKGGGYDDSGDYQEDGTKRIKLQGAILSNRESKIFKSGGSLTEQDKVLYLFKPLENDLQGAEIIHNKNLYRIGNKLENALFTGVFSYGLKFVSVFNEVEE